MHAYAITGDPQARPRQTQFHCCHQEEAIEATNAMGRSFMVCPIRGMEVISLITSLLYRGTKVFKKAKPCVYSLHM